MENRLQKWKNIHVLGKFMQFQQEFTLLIKAFSLIIAANRQQFPYTSLTCLINSSLKIELRFYSYFKLMGKNPSNKREKKIQNICELSKKKLKKVRKK